MKYEPKEPYKSDEMTKFADDQKLQKLQRFSAPLVEASDAEVKGVVSSFTTIHTNFYLGTASLTACCVFCKTSLYLKYPAKGDAGQCIPRWFTASKVPQLHDKCTCLSTWGGLDFTNVVTGDSDSSDED